MCLDELSFGGMLKRCGLLRGGRRCGGRDGVTPLMFGARTELTLHRTNRFGNSSRSSDVRSVEFVRYQSAVIAGARRDSLRRCDAHGQLPESVLHTYPGPRAAGAHRPTGSP
jgi:hypothetical protein